MNQQTSWRYQLIKVVFVGLGFIIVARLFSLQVLNHGRFNTLAAQQHLFRRDVIAERGKIFSSDGMPLATTQDAYLLFVVPPELTDKEKVIDLFVDRLPFKFKKCILSIQPEKQDDECELKDEEWEEARDKKKDELTQFINQEGRLWVPIIRGLPVSLRDSLDDMDIPGVYFQHEKIRAYPEDTLASHVLGFVGSDEFGRPTGYFGLEGFYNGELSGTHGFVQLEVDASGKPIPLGEYSPIEPEPGMDLVLTLKRELQFMLDSTLKEGVEKYQADFGTYILLDPKTGAIWAMGNYPTFDPGEWVDYLGDETDVSKVNVFRNYAITDNYEPGSVMKSFTMSVGVETNTVTESTTFGDYGPLEVQGHTIKTWNNKYQNKDITIGEILQLSNNPRAAEVGLRIGFDTFTNYLEKFGIGGLTGIDLQGEEAGVVKESDTWREIDLATASFGQGISLTPMQLALVMATIANDGVMMQPYVVQEIRNSQTEETIFTQPRAKSAPLSAGTAQAIRNLLQRVVDEGEFRWFVQNEGMDKFPLGGKTGTAQIPIPGGYDPNKTNVTFVGFSPVDDPQFVLLVRLNRTRTSTFSAETAVPLWLRMAKDLVTYFAIPPK